MAERDGAWNFRGSLYVTWKYLGTKWTTRHGSFTLYHTAILLQIIKYARALTRVSCTRAFSLRTIEFAGYTVPRVLNRRIKTKKKKKKTGKTRAREGGEKERKKKRNYRSNLEFENVRAEMGGLGSVTKGKKLNDGGGKGVRRGNLMLGRVAERQRSGSFPRERLLYTPFAFLAVSSPCFIVALILARVVGEVSRLRQLFTAAPASYDGHNSLAPPSLYSREPWEFTIVSSSRARRNFFLFSIRIGNLGMKVK